WRQVVQVVVIAFVESPSSGCTLLAAGFSRAQNGWFPTASNAQTAETGIVSTGFDHPVRPPATAKDQAANRAAISSCRGKTRARVAREGRRYRQDRARAQRLNQARRNNASSTWTLALLEIFLVM